MDVLTCNQGLSAEDGKGGLLLMVLYTRHALELPLFVPFACQGMPASRKGAQTLVNQVNVQVYILCIYIRIYIYRYV